MSCMRQFPSSLPVPLLLCLTTLFLSSFSGHPSDQYALAHQSECPYIELFVLEKYDDDILTILLQLHHHVIILNSDMPRHHDPSGAAVVLSLADPFYAFNLS